MHFPKYSTSSLANRYGELIATATVHVARMKKGNMTRVHYLTDIDLEEVVDLLAKITQLGTLLKDYYDPQQT